MKPEKLTKIIHKFNHLKFAVLGDFALDFYYDLQIDSGELSLETQEIVHFGSKPSISLGAAGNLAKNLRNLGIQVDCFGIKGDDLFGRELDYQLEKMGLGNYLMVHPYFDTTVYSKPLINLKETNRIDFGTNNPPAKEIKLNLLNELICRQDEYDFILLNEQINQALLSIEEIIYLEKNLNPKKVIGDFRKNGKWVNLFSLKLNLEEFNRIKQVHLSEEELAKIKISLEHFFEGREKFVLLTLGERGLIYKDAKEDFHVEGIPKKGEIDIVGAGDMVLAGFSSALGAGASPLEALEIANMAAYLSIHQINSTGKVFPKDILSLNNELNL